MRKLSYYLDFYTMPALVLAGLAVSPPDGLSWLGAVAAGYAGWALAEYWIHRELFHRHFRREHWRHHLRPTDEEGAVTATTSHVSVLVLTLLACGLLGTRLGLALSIGTVVGYWVYAVLHHGIHHRWFSPFGPLGGVVRRHELHHDGVEANFNFLLPLGDWLFGTYRDVPYGTYRHED